MKLELKHIAPYLPYGLIVKHNDEDTLLTDLHVSGIINPVKYEAGITSVIDVDEVKPILRPISSMTLEEIREMQGVVDNEGVYIAVSKSDIWFEEHVLDPNAGHMELYITDLYNAYEWLFKHHFDIFDLIDKGLAVDKTKLK